MTKRPSGESLGTVQRVIEIIRFFAEHPEATLKELSTALALAPSTCHRFLELLGRDGIVEQNAARRQYRVGRDLFRIAALVQSKHDVRTMALPLMRGVVDVCDETCVLSLYMPSERKIFFAEKVDSSMLLRYQLKMNTPISVFWGASGRSILAFLDKSEIDRIYAMKEIAPGSGKSPPARSTLEKELAAIRSRGYDITYGQKVAGAVGICAPVFDVDGKVLGSLGVTIPENRITAKDGPRLGELVRVTAEKLSAAIGSPRRDRLKATA